MKAIARFLLKPTVPVFHINGLISEKSFQDVEKCLHDARGSTAKAIAVVINSQGGSPTQGQKIINAIRFYAEKHHIPVYTFAEDLAASAAYQILMSGTKVFADEQSLVGSIGSVTTTINTKLILENAGLEIRRVSTNPASVTNQTYFNDMPDALRKTYEEKVQSQRQAFIQQVEQTRGDKIKMERSKRDVELYNGDVFSGKQALQMGLIDEIGSLEEVIAKDFPKAVLAFPKKQPIVGPIVEIAKLMSYFQTATQQK